MFPRFLITEYQAESFATQPPQKFENFRMQSKILGTSKKKFLRKFFTIPYHVINPKNSKFLQQILPPMQLLEFVYRVGLHMVAIIFMMRTKYAFNLSHIWD